MLHVRTLPMRHRVVGPCGDLLYGFKGTPSAPSPPATPGPSPTRRLFSSLSTVSQKFADSPVVGPAHRPSTCLAPSQLIPTGDEAQRRYAAAVQAHLGWQPVPGEFALSAVDINDVTYIGHDAGSNAQHVARWPAGQEYQRPSLTPTTLGPPEPVRRLPAQPAER